jgi:hypothetical protein
LHDQVLGIFEEVAQRAVVCFAHEGVGIAGVQPFRLKHCVLLVAGGAIQQQDDRIPAQLEIWTQRGEVAVAQPIGHAAGS